MCNSVHYRGREYSTPRDLADLLGGTDALVWREQKRAGGDGRSPLDLCLCPVDLARTLARAGFEWRHSDDPMEWHIERRDA